MLERHAEQVAALLNERNHLTVKYTAEKVRDEAEAYLLEIDNDVVVGCVEVRYVQWYQWEIRHLSVRSSHEGKGLGKRLIQQAEERALGGGARIVQCTIRVGNIASEESFRRSGYREACCFFNARSGGYIAVWQKVLVHRS